MESRASRLYAYRLANDQSMRDRFWLEYPQFISVAEQRGLEAADLLANVARNYVRGRADPELDTFLATQNLRQIIGYNHTEFRVMTTDEIAQSIERVRESVRYV